MNTLVDRLNKAEKEVLAIKTTQRTKSDSYIFYQTASGRYATSDNSFVVVEAIFHPKNDTGILCQFYIESDLSYSGATYAGYSIAVDNPLRCVAWFQNYSGSTKTGGRVICVSTADGWLETNIVREE